MEQKTTKYWNPHKQAWVEVWVTPSLCGVKLTRFVVNLLRQVKTQNKDAFENEADFDWTLSAPSQEKRMSFGGSRGLLKRVDKVTYEMTPKGKQLYLTWLLWQADPRTQRRYR